MISKIIAFNDQGGILLKRTYEESLENNDIFDSIKSSSFCNFIDGSHQIIFRKIEDIDLCFITRNENEFYILELINLLIKKIECEFNTMNEPVLSYYFKESHLILDNYIIDGKVVNLNMTCGIFPYKKSNNKL